MSLMPVGEALARLLDLAPRPARETVPLAEAAGRVLSTDAVAMRDQPPFAASAMDGYAVRAAEATAGARLEVAGTSAAGRRHDGPLAAGRAVRIFTGAPVPEGADTILIQENADRDGDHIRVREAPPPGAFVRPAGGDFAVGSRIAAPKRLTARDLALLAAMNVAKVTVARRPRVALIPTGDELVDPGETPGPDQIVSSNPLGLGPRLAEIGGDVQRCPIARDSRESLRAAFEAAVGADLVVTIGGASVGEHDLVGEVFAEMGGVRDFWRIAMRPGKPLMAGRLGGAMMVGLPGNPVSAMVCGEIFLIPVVEAALGLPSGPRRRVRARLASALPAGGVREHYMRARLLEERDGVRWLEVFDNQDSSLVATLAEADALAVQPIGGPTLPAGAWIEAILLDRA